MESEYWHLGDDGRRLSAEEQQLLVMRYAPLVRKIARSLPRDPGLIEFEDAVGYGMCGLVEAVRNYRPEGAGNFEAYAAKRIKGAMLDALRRADRLTRTMRHKAQLVQRAEVEQSASLGRPPSADEVADHLGMSRAQYDDAASNSRWVTVSLDRLLEPEAEGAASPAAEAPRAEEDIDITRAFDRQELREELVDAIRALPERERLVVSLYYVEQLSMKDVSVALGVSETRASQLHWQALRRLRSALQPAAA